MKSKPSLLNWLMRCQIRLACGLMLAAGLWLSGAAEHPARAQTSSEGTYVIQDDRVIDLRSGVEWLRCSVGQLYQDGSCTGQVLRLSQQEAAEAIRIANTELGGLWRLPSREELEFLVCEECEAPKIDERAFPGTVSEPYWTGQKNWISPNNLWSVNFMTGHSYGRFFPYQQLAVRLVRDR